VKDLHTLYWARPAFCLDTYALARKGNDYRLRLGVNIYKQEINQKLIQIERRERRESTAFSKENVR